MKNKTFTVNVRINAIVSFDVSAASLEDALTKAREEIKTTSFIAENIEHIDGTEEIIGVDGAWGLE